MAPNSKTHQTLLIKKEQIKKLKKLSKETRYPMTEIVDFAITNLFEHPRAIDVLRDGQPTMRNPFWLFIDGVTNKGKHIK